MPAAIFRWNKTIDEAISRIDCKPVTRVDVTRCRPGLVISCEVRRVDTIGSRYSLDAGVPPAIGAVDEIVVGGVYVVLGWNRRILIDQQPGLIYSSGRR